MKKALKIIVPILMVLALLLCLSWYLFVYDRGFTRDLLLDGARHFESKGNHKAAAHLYSLAYRQTSDNEQVAIELANHHIRDGNYTQAEAVLSHAIADGGGVELYVALCKTYVEQDKLLDAVALLDNVSRPEIKEKLDALRPSAPTASAAPGFYSQYIDVEITGTGSSLFATADADYPSVNQPQCTEPIALHEGENTIYAISVNEDGLVSPLAIFGYTVGGVIEQVRFQDPAMEAEIRSALGADETQVLFTNDLWDIKAFSVPQDAESYGDLKNLAYLEELTIESAKHGQLDFLSGLSSLTKLTIRSTAVSADDLAVIGNLPSLQHLTLTGCGLTACDGLEKAQKLVTLDLTNNAIRQADALASIPGITELTLQKNVLMDLAPLSGMKKLTKLDISYNTLTSLAPISNLSGLTWVDASHNSLEGLPAMDKLENLSILNISYNQLADVSQVYGCTGLAELNVSDNVLTDISGLSALSGLTYLDFRNNQVASLPQWSSDAALVEIHGERNKLSSVEALSGLKHLNNVFVDHNEEISTLDSLLDCPVLVQVNAYGTKVSNATRLLSNNIIVNFDPTA